MPKAILEFGVRGGHHVDNLVIPSAKLAAKLAVSLVDVLGASGGTEPGTGRSGEASYVVSRKNPRVTWQSCSHFVSVSIADNSNRGAASANLWRK